MLCQKIMDLVILELNSGGEIYIISSIFRNNKGGVAPNTLDSELLPPERESFIIGNLIENNNNLDAPAWDAQYISLGNGLIIAGGNNNYIKNNVIANHDVFGLVITAALDDNYWPAHGNIIEKNLIVDSRRADIALSGFSNMGNCFKGNQFKISFPPGLQLLNNCDSFSIPLGADLSGLWSSIARVVNANTGTYQKGNWKEFDKPSNQENMPIMRNLIEQNYDISKIPAGFLWNTVIPAVEVFESYQKYLENITLPKDAYKYFD